MQLLDMHAWDEEHSSSDEHPTSIGAAWVKKQTHELQEVFSFLKILPTNEVSETYLFCHSVHHPFQ